MALKFGTSGSSGLKRDAFPSHNGVQPGPLNSNSPAKFDLDAILDIGKNILGGEKKKDDWSMVKEHGGKNVKSKSKSGGTYESAKKQDSNLDKHIKERNRRQKSGENTATVQNKINEAYGNTKRHKEEITKMARIGDSTTTETKPIEATGTPESTVTQADAKSKKKESLWSRYKKYRRSETAAQVEDIINQGANVIGDTTKYKTTNQKDWQASQTHKQKTKQSSELHKLKTDPKTLALDTKTKELQNKRRQQLITATDNANLENPDNELASHGSFTKGETTDLNNNVYNKSLEENVKKRRG